MSDAVKAELIALNGKLLRAIAGGDWATYEQMCDPKLTCFEPEARGQLVEGMDFHRYYFNGAPPAAGSRQTTMCSPHVWLAGDMAVLCYIRLTQHPDASGAPVTTPMEETRVWQKQAGGWKHIHFHRSKPC